MKILYQISLALVVAWPSFAMSMKRDEITFRIVEYYVPDWIIGALLLRIIAATLFTISVLIALNKINFGLKFLAALLLIPVFDNVLFLLGFEKFQSLFLFTNTNTEASVQIVLLLLAFIWLLKMKSAVFQKKWLYAVVVVCSIGLSFIKPVYIDDWGTPTTNSPLTALELREFMRAQNLDIPGGQPVLLAFFTTSCPFCGLTAVKMGISKRNEKLPQTVVVFPGTKEDAEDFLASNGLDKTTYRLVDKETFLQYAGKSFPSLYYTSEQQTHHYTGSMFGYRALEYIAP